MVSQNFCPLGSDALYNNWSRKGCVLAHYIYTKDVNELFDDICYRYIYSDEQYLTYCKERSPLVRYDVNKKVKIQIYVH